MGLIPTSNSCFFVKIWIVKWQLKFHFDIFIAIGLNIQLLKICFVSTHEKINTTVGENTAQSLEPGESSGPIYFFFFLKISYNAGAQRRQILLLSPHLNWTYCVKKIPRITKGQLTGSGQVSNLR